MNNDIDVLLVYPRPTKDSPTRLTPLSILHAGAWFESRGLITEYLDQRFSTEEELNELILRSREIAVSVMTGYQSLEAHNILTTAKAIKPEIITSAGGPHVRIFPEQVLNEPYVDKIYSDRYYGEDLFPFSQKTKKIYKQSDLMYLTSTGCPFACRFCSQSSEWMPKNIETINYELSILHDELGFDSIVFSDQNLVYSTHVCDEKICKVDKVERIKSLGKIAGRLNFSWNGSMRCPDITPEMAEALSTSGCKALHLGAESGSQRVLKRIIKKGHGVEAIKNSVINLKGSGISTLYSFLAFMPGEKVEEIYETMDLVDWIMDTNPESRVSIYNYTPYPGTPMYDDALAGIEGYPKFNPPSTLKEWGSMELMASPLYWIAGLNFRLDNTKNNFPGEDWQLIEPYVKLARDKWKKRDILDFPSKEVADLIEMQVRKGDMKKSREVA